jgi:hypothetical protein
MLSAPFQRALSPMNLGKTVEWRLLLLHAIRNQIYEKEKVETYRI